MHQNWSIRLFASLLIAVALAYGQVGNGTITGTVSDPAGAVVAGAAVDVTNSETGVVYNGVTTNAGVYSVSNLPVGTYAVSVKVQGFKTYTHANLAVGAAQTLRENVALEVGTSAEAITVTAEASLLKTESGELSHNVTLEQMQDLPLLGIGTVNSGTSGY